jgi:hypothetical protein
MRNKPAEAKQKSRNEIREFALVLMLCAVLVLTLL